MKRKLFYLFVLFWISFGIINFKSNAQTTFGTQNIISTSADAANSVFACDLDGDGDYDVLSASVSDDKIAWYENTDGYGTFGTQQVITSAADGANSVFACDIDGDGDNDVLSASKEDDKIAWYENTDGVGTFGAGQTISTELMYVWQVFACDIDGDGDNDVLSASFNDSKVAWYENTDGEGTFGSQQIIIYMIHATSVYACDLDGDGDNDVISSSHSQDKISWNENTDGEGTFGTELTVSTSIVNPVCVYACDIDGDGDNDVLASCSDDGKIAWFENTDGAGTFGLEQVIATTVGGYTEVYACDIDGNGDNDVLSASYFYDLIAWYENTDSNGTFGSEQTICSTAVYATSVYACDVDGDGDNDVLSASYSDDEIAWYENLTPVYIESIQQNNITIYPNPTNGMIHIDFKNKDAIHIKVTDITGKLIIQETNTLHNKAVDLSGLVKGIYLIVIQTDKEVFTQKIVRK